MCCRIILVDPRCMTRTEYVVLLYAVGVELLSHGQTQEHPQGTRVISRCSTQAYIRSWYMTMLQYVLDSLRIAEWLQGGTHIFNNGNKQTRDFLNALLNAPLVKKYKLSTKITWILQWWEEQNSTVISFHAAGLAKMSMSSSCLLSVTGINYTVETCGESNNNETKYFGAILKSSTRVHVAPSLWSSREVSEITLRCEKLNFMTEPESNSVEEEYPNFHSLTPSNDDYWQECSVDGIRRGHSLVL